MDGVAFVVMPFGAFDAPAAGVSTMQAQLRSQGIPCDIYYLNLAFANTVGPELYNLVSFTSGEVFVGEWLFAQQLFSDKQIDYQGYVDRVLAKSGVYTPDAVRQICDLARVIPQFLDHCLRSVDWERYKIIGFTSMFEQNLGSLALAQRLKDRYPDKIIVMGGANCAAPMGVELHRQFPCIDYVFTGESDLLFPELAAAILAGRSPNGHAKGYVRRENGATVDAGLADCMANLDGLPFPDYDDFYRQYTATRLPRYGLHYLLFETARGCWWGHKNQCNFCGLNRHEIGYRAKSAGRALEEMRHLARRYGITHLMALDNILGMQYFGTLLPELHRRGPGFTLFYESKANLKREQIKLMRRAGIVSIQPGVEAFTENVLNLMHKGVTPLQNAQLLKWCRQYGITPMWNLLYGFPGENRQDYEITLEFVRTLLHLEAPMGFGTVRLERFSPLFDDPKRFGLRDIRPLAPYRHIYPFGEEVMRELAYFFEYDFDGKEKAPGWFAPVEAELTRWKTMPPASLTAVSPAPGQIAISDTRPTRVLPAYHFSDPEKSILEYCDEIRRFPDILAHARSVPRAPGAPQPDEAAVQRFLDYLVSHRLALRTGDRYLSVVLPAPDLTLQGHLQGQAVSRAG